MQYPEPDEAAALLPEIDAQKGLAGKDWTVAQARKLGLSDDEIAKLLSAR
jgi:hypothetical protein